MNKTKTRYISKLEAFFEWALPGLIIGLILGIIGTPLVKKQTSPDKIYSDTDVNKILNHVLTTYKGFNVYTKPVTLKDHVHISESIFLNNVILKGPDSLLINDHFYCGYGFFYKTGFKPDIDKNDGTYGKWRESK